MDNCSTNKLPTLSVVMPAYNEGGHIYDNLLLTSRTLSGFVKQYEIIAVNDGSLDNTAGEIQRAAAADSHILPAGYSSNKGKGYAIVTGVRQASGKYIAFLDSDLELNPKLLYFFLKQMKKYQADIVIGSKQHPRSKLNYPPIRKFMSYGYYLMLVLLFHLKLHDTQTGIKLFRASVIKPIAEKVVTNGYAFDIEILAYANRMGCKILEAPIELNYSRNDQKEGRRIRLKDILQVFKDTLMIKFRMIKNKTETSRLYGGKHEL